jgi:hypothetical protein
VLSQCSVAVLSRLAVHVKKGRKGRKRGKKRVVKPKQVHTQCCYDVVTVLSQCCYSVCRSVVMVSCTREEGLREAREGEVACGQAKTGAHAVLFQVCHSVDTVLLQCCYSAVTVLLQF